MDALLKHTQGGLGRLAGLVGLAKQARGFKKLQAALWAFLLPVALFAQGESVSIKGPNGPLSAEYHKPAFLAEGRKCPIVILCHGFGSNKQDALLRQVAAKLEQYGMATLSFDFAGSGASVSKMEFRDMTVKTELKDLESVIKYAKKLPFVSDVAIAGHSMGGAVSLLAAADEGRRTVKSLVLLAPAVSMREDAFRGSMLGAGFNPNDIPRKLSIGNLVIGRDFIEAARETNFLKAATEYKGETLVLFSTDDPAVLYTYGEYLDLLLPNSSLKLFKGLGHGFSKPDDPSKQDEVVTSVAEFLKKQML